MVIGEEADAEPEVSIAMVLGVADGRWHGRR